MDGVSDGAGLTDMLLGILGNRTRRRILELLAEEPRYLLQLSKELGVTMPAIKKHLEVLEDGSLVVSFEEKSDLGAPLRRYYRLKSSVYLTAGIANGFVTTNTLPITEKTLERIPRDLAMLREEVEQLREIKEHGERLKRADSLLAEVEDIARRLDDEKVFLLNLKQEIRRIASETIRQVSETGQERRILHMIIGSASPPEPEIISARLEIRERTVEEFLNELERKGIGIAKRVKKVPGNNG